MAIPLGVGTPVSLEVAGTNDCDARVTFCEGGRLTLELVDELSKGTVQEGSVVGMSSPLSWGQYRWLCIVGSLSDREVVIQLLDGPTFVPRRSDPRAGVEMPADIRLLYRGDLGQPHQVVITDLSRGGMKVEGALLLLSGDIVDVTMDLSPEGATAPLSVSALGRVVTINRENRGGGPDKMQAHIQFIGGQLEAIEALDRFIEERLKGRRRG
jgi:hypothetical protein